MSLLYALKITSETEERVEDKSYEGAVEEGSIVEMNEGTI